MRSSTCSGLRGGLDSLVVGEGEILRQVRIAHDQAQAAGTLGNLMRPLFEQVLSAGKRIRTDTDLGQGTLSVARVGVDVAGKALGNLDSVRALLVGAGETSQLVAKHLASEGVPTIACANRTLSNAESLAGQYGGQAFTLEDLPRALSLADLVITAVDDAPGLVNDALLDRRALGRRDRPLVVIDLSIPRAVDPTVNDLEGLLLFGLDDLEPVVEQNREGRSAATVRANEMIVGQVHEFLSRRAYALFSPALSELPPRFESLREATLDDVTAGQATPRELELAHHLTKRMLHLALGHLKDGVRRVQSETALDREYQRFLDNL